MTRLANTGTTTARENGRTYLATEVSEAVGELRDQGLTILRGVLEEPVTTALRTAIEDERAHLRDADPEGLARTSPALGSPAHTGFLCPFREPFVSSDVLAAELPLRVTEEYLGGAVYLHEIVVNFALAGQGTAQVPHMDQEPEEPGPVGVVWNIALCRLGPENGMTAVHPGSHRGRLEDSIGRDQPRMECGDVLIRDLSLFHNGAPNPSAEDRMLPAYVVKPPWQTLPEDFVSPVEAGVWDEPGSPRDSLLRRHRREAGAGPLHGRAYPIPESLQ